MARLVKALNGGDPDEVADLIARGHDIHYRREHGHTALGDAVSGRDVAPDVRLLDLLRLLVSHGVDLNAASHHNESGLRVLSRIGRFDAVRLLLDAGADENQLGWTPLMRAVALGSLDDMDRELDAGADLEARDWWKRTAFHLALMTGDLVKVERLFDRGADADALGLEGPGLFYAIGSHHPRVVQWLLEVGADVDQTTHGGVTPLMHAADEDDAECAALLVAAGADVHRYAFGTALDRVRSRTVADTLLAAGADPAHLSREGHRALAGLPPDPDERLLTATPEEFRRASTRRFGTANPEPMDEPFWLAMIRSGVTAYAAAQKFGVAGTCPRDPIWCAWRFGQSITPLPDGRVVRIAGEHEDHYDIDFCIHNDVIVHAPGGSIAIFGYPETVFPPTDFHTATLVGGAIYVIGSLGYHGRRRPGETPVFRLDLGTFRMERLEPRGDAPGWIYKHRADAVEGREIRVREGSVVTMRDGKEAHDPNPSTFVLDLDGLTWRRL
jgi:ankyrin repeat protein